MLFNSLEFIVLFLPITLWVFHRLCVSGFSQPAKIWLVFASLGFYGWWEPKYLLLISASMVANYVIALALQKMPDHNARSRFFLVAFGVLGNLGAIGWFKYAGFLVTVSNDVFGTEFHIRQILLPLAISFFTFQQIAYLVEVYRRTHGAGRVGTYLLFVTFFPQLIAGPIVNYKDMAPQFDRITQGLVPGHLLLGLIVFSVGLFKKVIIADGVAPYSDTVFTLAASGVNVSFLEAWAGAVAYSIQLYFDFSGYSDMALGLGCMVGIRLPRNFDSPYKATSIIDFWRRWHISLSTFLRDYLYVPLGGNQKGAVRTLIHLMIVMVLGGLWHGAGWTFVAWGALHGIYLLINHLWRLLQSNKLSDDSTANKSLSWVNVILSVGKKFGSQCLTLTAVVVAWVLFRASNLQEALVIIRGMFGFNGLSLPTSWLNSHPQWVEALSTLGVTFQELATLGPVFTPVADVMRLLGVGNAMNNAGTLTALVTLLIPIAMVFMLPNSGRLMEIRFSTRTLYAAVPIAAFLAAYGAFGGTGTAQFLYFNF